MSLEKQNDLGKTQSQSECLNLTFNSYVYMYMGVCVCVCVYSNDCVTIYIYEFVIAFQETWKTGTLNATF